MHALAAQPHIQTSPLTQYALRGLKNCYMPGKHGWSYIYHLDGRVAPNESFPLKDHFYSLNVILGLARAGQHAWQNEYDLPFLLHENARALLRLNVPPYAYGMALWASGELGVALEAPAYLHICRHLQEKKQWHGFTAQDTGMILSGICAQKRSGNNDFDRVATSLFHFVANDLRSDSGLFRNDSHSLRRNLTSFASQAYLITALYHYGSCYRSKEALALADMATSRMLAMQGLNGEWPWFYHAPKGLVVDQYEIYSVHQYGMAPLFLSQAEKRGIKGAREAIIKGFFWQFENNDLQQNMLVPSLGMFYRSIARSGELERRHIRLARSITHSMLNKTAQHEPASRLSLRKECRSYELGWLLYAFSDRMDLPHITQHNQFTLSYR